MDLALQAYDACRFLRLSFFFVDLRRAQSGAD